MKRLLVTVFLLSIAGHLFAQFSTTFDTVKLYRGGRLYQLVTYGTDSVKINGITYDMASARAVSYWTSITATRVNDSTFTVVGNSQALLQRGTVLKWTESGTKQAMVTESVYSSPNTTISIMGDDLAAGFTSMKYGKEKARTMTLAYAGTVATTGADVLGHAYTPFDCKIFGVDIYLGTAGGVSGGNTMIDVIDRGRSIMSWKPAISSNYTSCYSASCVDGESITVGKSLSVDILEVNTTPGIDLYVTIFYTPLYNTYLP